MSTSLDHHLPAAFLRHSKRGAETWRDKLQSWLCHEVATVEQCRFMTRQGYWAEFGDFEDVFEFVSRKLENDAEAIVSLYKAWAAWCDHWKEGDRVPMELPRGESFEDAFRMRFIIYRDNLRELGRLP